MTERRLQQILGALLTLAVLGTLAVGIRAHHAAETETAGTAAMKAARTSVPAILSYTDSSLANQLAASRSLMTSDYAKRYTAMVKSRVWPQAKKFGVANQVGVVSTGIVRANENTAVILIFANQTTRTKAKPKGLTQGTRLEVTMQRRKSTWLIDEMRPL